ncbi:hypothetical protein [Roseibium sp.]|uniref:hypothetical protein n=1 Tax=Roseibium sp. TaxID=1936156 RepID=UPI003B51CF80
MKNILKVLSIATCGLLAAVTVSSSGEKYWDSFTYHSYLWGYSIEMPHGMVPSFIDDPEDLEEFKRRDNNGITFVYPEYKTLKVSTEVDTTNLSFKAYRNEWKSELSSDGSKITYEASGKDWFVFSGLYGNDTVYYYKVINLPCSDSVAALWISFVYPKDYKDFHDEKIAPTLKTLKRQEAC